jgi:oligopeptide/dipeptide ABC transporter ATP-binding protein
MTGNGAAPLLEVRGLVKHFPIRSGWWRKPSAWVRAVDGIDLELAERGCFALVGESGCGKSTTARCILRLIEPDRGVVRFNGTELLSLGARELRRQRREMQMVFQDASSSLDPRMRVEAIVAEPLDIHRLGSKASRKQRVRELLITVGLGEQLLGRYPHQLSGGQRQRVGMARALALRPKLVIADEPVSALDVSVQAQVLQLMLELQQQHGLAYLLIAHDLGVVQRVADAIAVMYLGKIVERAPAAELFAAPLHPYTHALLAAVPQPDPTGRSERRRARTRIAGELPSAVAPPPGCAYHTRCPRAEGRCRVEEPRLEQLRPGHWVACHFPVEWKAGTSG